MLGALLYLRLTSLKNRLRTQLVRLKQPKYLLGAGFVVLYFWFFFFRGNNSPVRAMGKGGVFAGIPHESQPVILGLAAVGVSLVFVFMWLFPSDQPGLKFTEAEIAFLFPAPLTRRALLHFKVLSLQLSSLFQSLFFALIFSNRNLLHGHSLRTIVSWWLVLSCINLHYLGSSLSIARLAAVGVHTRQRRIALVAGLGVLAVAAAWLMWREFPEAAGASSLMDWLAGAFETGVLSWLLLPVTLMLKPFFAADVGAFLVALVPAVAILAAQYWWVVSMNVAFEEASIAQAERLAARLAELRRTGTLTVGGKPRGARKAPFNVSNTRWVELAFLWKNLLSTASSWLNARTWRILLAFVVVLALGLRGYLGHKYWMFGAGLATVGGIGIFMALFYGPLLTRLDLRQDITNIDILKTYPLPGWRIVLGELLAPTAVLTGIIWLGLACWYLGLSWHQPPKLSLEWFNPSMKMLLVGCAAVLTPFVVALQLLVPNGAVMFFPAMFRVSQTPGGGIDLMGQRMLFGFGQIFVLLFIFLPALAVCGGSYFVVRGILEVLARTGAGVSPEISPVAATLGLSGLFAVVVAGEIWCGVWWLGERFERLDPSNDVRP